MRHSSHQTAWVAGVVDSGMTAQLGYAQVGPRVSPFLRVWVRMDQSVKAAFKTAVGLGLGDTRDIDRRLYIVAKHQERVLQLVLPYSQRYREIEMLLNIRHMIDERNRHPERVVPKVEEAIRTVWKAYKNV